MEPVIEIQVALPVRVQPCEQLACHVSGEVEATEDVPATLDPSEECLQLHDGLGPLRFLSHTVYQRLLIEIELTIESLLGMPIVVLDVSEDLLEAALLPVDYEAS